MSNAPLMPMATAVWLVENTTLIVMVLDLNKILNKQTYFKRLFTESPRFRKGKLPLSTPSNNLPFED